MKLLFCRCEEVIRHNELHIFHIPSFKNFDMTQGRSLASPVTFPECKSVLITSG